MIIWFRKIAKLRKRIGQLKLKYQQIGFSECKILYEDRIERINEKHELQLKDARREEKDKQRARIDDLSKEVDDLKTRINRENKLVDENRQKEAFWRDREVSFERLNDRVKESVGSIIAELGGFLNPIQQHMDKIKKEENNEVKKIVSNGRGKD